MATHSDAENSDSTEIAALQHRNWRRAPALSSGLLTVLSAIERFLGQAQFDRAPWLVVAFGAGIGLWFVLDNPWQWLAAISLSLSVAAGTAAWLRADGAFPFVRQALIAAALMLAMGAAIIWTKSVLVGRAPISAPIVTRLSATVIGREEQPAQERVRLVLITQAPGEARQIGVRVNLPQAEDNPAIRPGAQVSLKARLVPPAPPMLPGAYDFARQAWFKGISATGSVLGPVEMVRPAAASTFDVSAIQASLSHHVRERLPGDAGAIAAAFASGDRGAISPLHEAVMRDAGLSHLLSISGLHVSAVIGAAYFLAMRLLALWPWLALRVRLPLFAAGLGAVAGIGYTVLSGAEVPTVRSCLGAMLVLAAMAMGREPLSMRMLAVAAFLILLFWPESLVSPGFQMSFTSVIAIIALHECGPARSFLAPREETWLRRSGRRMVMLLVTGLAIEAALMPIGLYHFSKAGVYGAFANVIAIPLTTFVSMPAIALALTFDLIGAGAPFWWLAGLSLDAMLALAGWVAARPSAVTSLPGMGLVPILLFVAGGLWLALWHGRVRLWGLVALPPALVIMLGKPAPDLLVTSDGRHVAVIEPDSGKLLLLRGSRGSFVRDNLLAQSGIVEPLIAQAGLPSGSQEGAPARTPAQAAPVAIVMAQWPGAQCNDAFCQIVVSRGGRDWLVLMTRNRDRVPERALAAACERADVVISDRWLPRSCRPRWLKADKATLARTGGLAIDFSHGRMTTVAEGQGNHGWWRPLPDRPVFAAVPLPKADKTRSHAAEPPVGQGGPAAR